MTKISRGGITALFICTLIVGAYSSQSVAKAGIFQAKAGSNEGNTKKRIKDIRSRAMWMKQHQAEAAVAFYDDATLALFKVERSTELAIIYGALKHKSYGGVAFLAYYHNHVVYVELGYNGTPTDYGDLNQYFAAMHPQIIKKNGHLMLVLHSDKIIEGKGDKRRLKRKKLIDELTGKASPFLKGFIY